MIRRQSFVVIVERDSHRRVFGPYRSFKRAEGDANAWEGRPGVLTTVYPIETVDSPEPWDPAFYDVVRS